ncbi:unnamed protein product [Lymnaea stagnalis]|uniref:Exonuclease domain-containing protein n=1 Tax=Lymnaea stagnalis TaxID=6523 RepID=A0AAV2I567_LYMST
MNQTVKTFVIFDTETTGLPSPGNNPRITELSFIALLRDELLSKSRAPRVVNKLLLCFNPQKKIKTESSSLTGLYNDALEAYSPFKSHASLICSFLTTLPQPACLVAHNGNDFDFPLLISELNNAEQPVPPNILCADSLEGFRELDGLPKQPGFVKNKRKNQVFTVVIETHNWNANKETLDPNIFHSVSPSEPARFPEDVHQLWSKDAGTPQYSSSVSSSKGPNAKLKQEIVRDEAANKTKRKLFSNQTCVDEVKKSETISSHENCESLPLYPNNLNNVADIPSPNSPQTPDTFSPWSTNSEAEVIYAAEQAELNFIPEPGGTTKIQPPQETPSSISVCDTGSTTVGLGYSNINERRPKKGSYSLPKLYRCIFGQDPIDSHTAEDDCKTLLCVIQTKALSFCQWCDKNAEQLINLNPMY